MLFFMFELPASELNPKLMVRRSIGLVSIAMHLQEAAHPSQTGCSQAVRDLFSTAFLMSFAQQ